VSNTNLRGGQVKDGNIQRVDLDIATVGQAVILKLLLGNGLTLVSSTGADAGTGDVTIKVDDALSLVTSLTSPIVQGSVSASGNLTLKSTSNATKGKILFGASAYDEANDRIGIQVASPLVALQVGSVSSGTGEATNKGTVLIQASGGATSSAGGLEFKAASGGNGYGWRIGAPDLGSGSNPLIVMNRNGSASWTEYLRIKETGHVLINSTTDNAYVYLVQPAYTTSGHFKALRIDGGAHTALTASTEAIAIDFNLARTVQFATGALTLQRDVVFRAPTYAFVGASTLSDAATVEIAGSPKAGTNATITRQWALRVTDATGQLARVGLIGLNGNATLVLNVDSAYQADVLFQDLGTTKYTIRYDGTAGETSHTAVAGSAVGLYVTSGANLTLTGAGNIGLWGTIFGTSAVKVLALTGTTGTLPSVEPTTSPADVIQLWAKDGAAGACELYIRNEAGRVKRLTGDFCTVTSDFSRTSSLVLTNVTGLSFNVEAGKTYSFEAVLLFSNGSVTPGAKVAIGGGCTVTSLITDAIMIDGSTVYTGRATSLGSAIVSAGPTDNVDFSVTVRGTVTVNAAGTLTVQIAQASNNASATTVKAGSYFKLIS
jgi:hypothetical protein